MVNQKDLHDKVCELEELYLWDVIHSPKPPSEGVLDRIEELISEVKNRLKGES